MYALLLAFSPDSLPPTVRSTSPPHPLVSEKGPPGLRLHSERHIPRLTLEVVFVALAWRAGQGRGDTPGDVEPEKSRFFFMFTPLQLLFCLLLSQSLFHFYFLSLLLAGELLSIVKGHFGFSEGRGGIGKS